MTILNHTLGFPRIGLRRELKKALESYWAGDSTQQALLATGRGRDTGNSRKRRASICCRSAISPGMIMC